MRRNGRQGFLGVPYELDDLPLWDGDAALKAVFLQLCFWANHAPGEVTWRRSRHELARGEVVTSSYELAEKTGFSRKVIRRCISKLQDEGLISWRQEITEGLADAKKGLAKGLAETIYIINDYDDLFDIKKRNGPSKGPRTPRKGAQLDNFVPLYAGNTSTHTQDGDVCESSCDGGKPADPAGPSPSECSLLKHPLVIAWNAACERSKLQKVSSVPPGRQRLLEAAMRYRNDLSWWQVVFDEAAKPISIQGKPWLPKFNQALELDRAAQYHESRRKVVSLKPVPKPTTGEPPVECDSRDGASGHVPAKPQAPRDLSRSLANLAQFRRSLESKNLASDGGPVEAGARPGSAGQLGPSDARPGGVSGVAGD